MNQAETSRERLALVQRYVKALCGLYSQIARQFKVDRSFVSRVVRGERHSEEIEHALTKEFGRITDELDRPTPNR